MWEVVAVLLVDLLNPRLVAAVDRVTSLVADKENAVVFVQLVNLPKAWVVG